MFFPDFYPVNIELSEAITELQIFGVKMSRGDKGNKGSPGIVVKAVSPCGGEFVQIDGILNRWWRVTGCGEV